MCSSRTNEQNFMKFYIQYHPNINQCLSTFGKNRSTDGAAIKRFPDFLGCADLGFYWMKSYKNLYTKYIQLEIIMMQFGCIQLNRGRCYSVFFKILVIVLSRILLHGTVRNFACNVLILQNDINVIFASIACQGALLPQIE